MTEKPLSWIGIVRLGLVQAALGAIVVLTTSTMNRIMVVELALPAVLPGFLVGLHYALQLLRPRLGYGSDIGRRRTPWIVGGMAVLAIGGTAAAAATALMGVNPIAGILAAVVAFALIGVGVGASGTCLLVLLAARVAERRRPAAATVTWVMMILGIVATAGLAGHFLDPYSPGRLVLVAGVVSLVALVVTILAVLGVEGTAPATDPQAGLGESDADRGFRHALAEVWAEPDARRFAVFVFVSMLAYSSQDLILEPFAGLVFGLTPGQSTQLAGVHHGGVLMGMILVGVLGSLVGGMGRTASDPAPAGWRKLGSMRHWMIGGCVGSAMALGALAVGGLSVPAWPLHLTVLALGFCNGVFAVAAIASMMTLVGSGRKRREGTRMGLWGAAQAVAFGLGGLMGAAAVDLMRTITEAPAVAYGTVFVCEGLLFLVAANLALRLHRAKNRAPSVSFPLAGDRLATSSVRR